MYGSADFLQHCVQISHLMHECMLHVAVILEQKALLLLAMINILFAIELLFSFCNFIVFRWKHV